MGLPGTEFGNGDIPMPKPPITMEQLRKAIPEECFQKDLAKSLLYMLRDFAFIATLYWFRLLVILVVLGSFQRAMTVRVCILTFVCSF